MNILTTDGQEIEAVEVRAYRLYGESSGHAHYECREAGGEWRPFKKRDNYDTIRVQALRWKPREPYRVVDGRQTWIQWSEVFEAKPTIPKRKYKRRKKQEVIDG